MSNDAERLKRELFIRSLLPALPGEAAARLSEMLSAISPTPGTILFHEGEPPDDIYFVLEGEVVLERAGEKPWIFGGLSIVGVIDATLNRPRLRGARVTRDSRLYRLRSKTWLDLLEEDVSLARGATTNVARQVHEQWLSVVRSLAYRVVSSIPPPLDAPISLYEKILTLRDAALFRAAGMQAIASLAQAAEEVPLSDNELLFDVGAAIDTQYIVMYGVIELSRASPEVRVRYGVGEVVAACAALSGELAAYAARSRGKSVVLRIRDEEYYDQAEAHPDLIRAALGYLMQERERLVLAKDSVEARAS